MDEFLLRLFSNWSISSTASAENGKKIKHNHLSSFKTIHPFEKIVKKEEK
jgi:hypothetical protein